MSKLFKRIEKITPCVFNHEEGCYIMEFGPVLGAADTVKETRRRFRHFLQIHLEEYVDDNLALPGALEEVFITKLKKDISKWRGTGIPLAMVVIGEP